jgi:hypothetical protein
MGWAARIPGWKRRERSAAETESGIESAVREMAGGCDLRVGRGEARPDGDDLPVLLHNQTLGIVVPARKIDGDETARAE